MTDRIIQVPYKVLYPILMEMQATRGLPGFTNEIDELVNLFNEQVEKHRDAQRKIHNSIPK